MARCYHSDRKKEGKIEFLLKIIIDFEKDFNSLEECGQNVEYIYIFYFYYYFFFYLMLESLQILWSPWLLCTHCMPTK